MNNYLARARILYEQDRPQEALEYLQQAMTEDPNDDEVFNLLASVYLDLEQWDAAEEAARKTIELAPDLPSSHSCMAVVLFMRNRLKHALASIDEAISLWPLSAHLHGLRARILLDMKRPQDALAAAENGLSLDPEEVSCNNVRAMALVRLRRVGEAGATLEATLAADPDDTYTHANMGWTQLHAGNPNAALRHFQEALRLYPENDYAREGMIAALKARNPFYSAFLNAMLWINRLSPSARWGVLIGIFFAYPILDNIATAYPPLMYVALPLKWAILFFCVSTWVADPFFDALLMLSPYGRHALRRPAKIVGVIVLGLIVVALGILAMRLLLLAPFLETLALATLSLAIIADGLMRFDEGNGRWVWRIGSVILIALFVGLIIRSVTVFRLYFDAAASPAMISAAEAAAAGFLSKYMYGIIILAVGYNILVGRRARR